MSQGELINKFKHEGHLIEIYKRGSFFVGVINASFSTGQCFTHKRAFQEAIKVMEGKGMKISEELRGLSQKMTKIAMSPSQVIRKVEKLMEATLEDAYVTEKSHPGSYHYPPESGEIEVKHAYIEKFPELSIEEAELLPNRFECAVAETFRDDELNEEAGVLLYFDVTIESKNILPNGKVEVEWSDRFTGWDYN